MWEEPGFLKRVLCEVFKMKSKLWGKKSSGSSLCLPVSYLLKLWAFLHAMTFVAHLEIPVFDVLVLLLWQF